MAGESSFYVYELVAQADIGEGAADHYLVIAAARTVGVEVGGLDAVLLQIFSGGAVFLDGSGGRDVVGGDAVAEHCQDARTLDFFYRRRFDLHAFEVGSAADVGGIFFPGVGLAFGNLEAAPALVTL